MKRIRRWWYHLVAFIRSIGARCFICNESLTGREWFRLAGGVKACRDCSVRVLEWERLRREQAERARFSKVRP